MAKSQKVSNTYHSAIGQKEVTLEKYSYFYIKYFSMEKPVRIKKVCPICLNKVITEVIWDDGILRIYKCPKIGKDGMYHTFENCLTIVGMIMDEFNTIKK